MSAPQLYGSIHGILALIQMNMPFQFYAALEDFIEHIAVLNIGS